MPPVIYNPESRLDSSPAIKELPFTKLPLRAQINVSNLLWASGYTSAHQVV
jgi:hypothetical protein